MCLRCQTTQTVLGHELDEPSRADPHFGLTEGNNSAIVPHGVLLVRDPSVMAQTILVNRHLVSVVTPFFNTAPYLAECIESVLAQSYSQFEYILMDNCSTDGSSEIAATYASRDPRIRLIRCSQFLSQLANYNRALTEISDASTYCKIVQADDWIFPECLQLMVRAFEPSESIGLVSSYWLNGNELCGAGLPPQTTMLTGRECARRYLRTGTCLFATQTQVMYRSSLVRDHAAFYNVSLAFADLQKHMEILEQWDFGFVHQVLSFSRRDNEGSIYGSLQQFAPSHLLEYIFARRYAPALLEAGEAASIIAKYKREYYRFLARAALRLRERAFWQFHKVGLKTLSEHETHDWPYLAMMMAPELLWLASNPGMTTIRALRSLRRKKRPSRLSDFEGGGVGRADVSQGMGDSNI
jgi:glycosyltransferase involved in cell wall biosynthesis